MGIYLYCQSCKTNNEPAEKKCRKCGEPFPSTGRKYRVRVKLANKVVNRFTHSLTLAREIEGAIAGDIARGKFDVYQKKKVITLGELFEKYIKWAKENKKSWGDDHRRYVQFIGPQLGSKRLDQISPLDLERFKSQLKQALTRRGKPYAPATIKQHLIIIRRLFNVAKKWGLFKGANPLDRVTMPKIDNQRVRFLSDTELESLLNTLETWACRESVDFITFALLTGFRLGELITLKWESVDFENGYITHADPKGGKTVTVPVSSEALDVLRLRDRISEYVFPGEDGGRRFDFKGPWLRVCRAAGISDFRFHDLRHNFASQLISSDVNLATVQVLLSHKDIRTTLKYAHLQPGAARDAARASGKLLTRKSGAEVVDFQEGKK